MRRITPDDYAMKMTPMERLALDSWIEAEGIGPVTDIVELRELDSGVVEVDRALRDEDGHRFRVGDHIAMKTLYLDPDEPMP